MCGIVASLPVYSGTDTSEAFVRRLSAVEGDVSGLPKDAAFGEWHTAVTTLGERLRELRDAGECAATCLLLCTDRGLAERVRAVAGTLTEWVAAQEAELRDRTARDGQRKGPELRRLGDDLWAFVHDYLDVLAGAWELSRRAAGARSILAWVALMRVLRSIDYLEVRGRDSAGVAVSVSWDGGPALDVPAQRGDPLFRDGSCVRTATGLAFVYKHASVVGKLGDNVAAITASIAADDLLHEAMELPGASAAILAHTRWASVGRVNEQNAHPVNSVTDAGDPASPVVLSVLNGDIDNYEALPLVEGALARSDQGITTDAKVIPVAVSRLMRGDRAGAGDSASGAGANAASTGAAASTGSAEAFRRAFELFSGSMAIAVWAEDGPDALLLGVKGSGQSLYLGQSRATVHIASEAYGVVGVSDTVLHIDAAATPDGDRSGVVVRVASGPDGAAIERTDARGAAVPVADGEWAPAEVTTRDLDLQGYDHYLQKEIAQSSLSFSKTLQGKVADADGRLAVDLPEETLPARVDQALRAGTVRQVLVIGQGTAGIAAQGVAQVMEQLHGERLPATALLATELSAHYLRPDMSDTLVVAISQSGSTTDTNRAVDLVKDRGALVLAIVNRRSSDLEAKSHAVLYTSDGRDIEMAVASTKAFYSQAAAGCLLALAFGRATEAVGPAAEDEYLRALSGIPEQLDAVGAKSGDIAELVDAHVLRSRYWSVVGSGAGLVAAEETRIKLSELCYRTVSVDSIEDKKHIDLSAEALTLVCLAGAAPSELSDLSKEVAILKAHANPPVVICDSGSEDLWRGADCIGVPRTKSSLGWILCTAAGHLFAYHAAKRIDSAADPLRLALAALDSWAVEGHDTAAADAEREIRDFLMIAAHGGLNGVLSPDAALQVNSLVGDLSNARMRGSAAERERLVPTGRGVLEAAIAELSRPVDTVRHQAKTVTVGTSRTDAGVFDNEVVQYLRAQGVDLATSGIGVIRAINAFSRVVAAVDGMTAYDVASGYVSVERKLGVSAGIASRADDAPQRLVGSKRRAMETESALLLQGASDGRTIVIVPEPDRARTSRDGRLYVLHVSLKAEASAADVIGALRQMGERREALRETVSEVVPGFEDAMITRVPLELVLFGSPEAVAQALL